MLPLHHSCSFRHLYASQNRAAGSMYLLVLIFCGAPVIGIKKIFIAEL